MSRFNCLDGQGPQTAFAELVGVSEPAVSDLVKRGVLTRGDTLHQWLLAYTKHIRAAAAGWREQDGKGSLTEARIREANAKAFRAEVETGKELGLLVYRHEVEQQLKSWAARGCQAIEAAERRIVDSIASEFGITIEDRHVSDHLRAAQRDIAGYPRESECDDDGGEPGMAPARTGTDG